MTPKLTEEQRQAIQQHPGGAVPVEDDQTHRQYVIIDRSTHEQQAAALRQKEDTDAIGAGIADMEAGRVVSFEQVDDRIRKELGLRAR